MAEKTTKELPGGMIEVSTTVKDGQKNVPLTYTVPSFEAFGAWFTQLIKVHPADYKGDALSQRAVYDRFVYATDLKERAAVRESVAAESTTITVKGQSVDIMGMPDLKAVQAVNAAHLWAATTGNEPQKAAVVARRKLLEAGRAVEADGGMLKVATKK